MVTILRQQVCISCCCLFDGFIAIVVAVAAVAAVAYVFDDDDVAVVVVFVVVGLDLVCTCLSFV